METVTSEVTGCVAWLTLDRPEVMNAFDARLQELR
jgi:enoyl-CoA hydratase/carnithine racemase